MIDTLTRKDFLYYLEYGGSFNKVVYLNKKRFSKLTKDQKKAITLLLSMVMKNTQEGMAFRHLNQK